jgi:Fe-S cluster assembly protein SufD
MAIATKEHIDFKSLFASHLSNTNFPQAIQSLQQEALEQFGEMGLPGMKHEEWKYTYLQKYLKKGFQFGRNPETASPESASIPTASEDAVQVILMDGKCISIRGEKTQEGIYLSGLKQALEAENILATELFGALAHGSRQALTALNLALCEDGFFLHAAPEAKGNIDLIFLHSGSPYISQPHILIKLEEGADVHIQEQHIQVGEQSFQHLVSEVILEKSARLEWVKTQDAGAGSHLIDTVYAQVEAEGLFKSMFISLTGELFRNNQYINIHGTAADADLNGVYVLDSEQQADNVIVIRHQLPEGTSNQLFKGILDGKSTGVFNGKIIVDQDAQKTNAFQSNKNILVSDEAAAYFRPQLEIFADDVKCSHGATSSEIEDGELFYLRARGIGKEMARALLMLAYAADVLESISKDDVKQKALKSIEKKLKLNF